MRRFMTAIIGLALIANAMGQSWTSAYDTGLKAAKDGKWAEARKAFLQSRANRPDDVSGPTNLPGPVTDARRWRNGSPYSPNFLAAYCAFKAGVAGKSDQFKVAADEFEGLLKKKQVSNEALFYLGAIYSQTNQTDKMSALTKFTGKANWKVDSEVLAPEEISAMGSGASAGGGITQVIDAGKVPTYSPTAASLGPVQISPKKFALIVANGDNKLAGFQIGHAANDAKLIKNSITTNAGYSAANVETVLNGSADAIKKAATALAARMPAEGTLFLFFTGAGANIDGRDWIAGVDTQLVTDTSSMLAKSDLYRPFTEKGVSIFSFFQVPRLTTVGKTFGSEEIRAGRIAQMQSTIAGEGIFSIFRDGSNVGIFAGAMSDVFAELHSNAIPITEFGWQVFYKIRRGNTGSAGGGSRQTPTLPVLQLLASDSRF